MFYSVWWQSNIGDKLSHKATEYINQVMLKGNSMKRINDTILVTVASSGRIQYLTLIVNYVRVISYFILKFIEN